ncbi:MAG: helix-turn-helix domain-containing protein [Pseudonocardiaceae bacterium]
MAPPLRAPTSTGPRFLSIAAVARVLAVSEVTLYRAIRSGEFPAVKVRGRYVIPASALDALEHAAVDTGRLVDAALWAAGGASS